MWKIPDLDFLSNWDWEKDDRVCRISKKRGNQQHESKRNYLRPFPISWACTPSHLLRDHLPSVPIAMTDGGSIFGSPRRRPRTPFAVLICRTRPRVPTQNIPFERSLADRMHLITPRLHSRMSPSTRLDQAVRRRP